MFGSKFSGFANSVARGAFRNVRDEAWFKIDWTTGMFHRNGPDQF